MTERDFTRLACIEAREMRQRIRAERQARVLALAAAGEAVPIIAERMSLSRNEVGRILREAGPLGV